MQHLGAGRDTAGKIEAAIILTSASSEGYPGMGKHKP
jgi:hypothetical protein